MGLLAEVNRTFLHPLGLALEEIIDEETGEVHIVTDKCEKCLVERIEHLQPKSGDIVWVCFEDELSEDEAYQFAERIARHIADSGAIVVFGNKTRKADLALLDEDKMREHGWIRIERLPGMVQDWLDWSRTTLIKEE